MKLYFGLQWDDITYNAQPQTQGGKYIVGAKGFLRLLEAWTGNTRPATENSLLRVEQYRQVLKVCLKKYGTAFYQSSFEADELATAETLLGMRDELVLAGLDFEQLTDDFPERIQTLQVAEAQAKGKVTVGIADRFQNVIQELGTAQLPLTHIKVHEPKHLLPAHLRYVLEILAQKNISIDYLPEREITATNDLSRFQYRIAHTEDAQNGKMKLAADGSLIILRAKRETEAAAFIAQLLRHNPNSQPVCLIPEKDRTLDTAIIQEGLPSMGILSASLGRPSLQLLKLVSVFLWRPLDPFKVLEFLSLPLKPLDHKLANILARTMAQTPGLNGELWFVRVREYFEELEEKAQQDSSININSIRNQYETWFDRKSNVYPISGYVPVTEAIQLYEYIKNWAGKEFDNLGSKNVSLLTLREQAKKVVELLEELPETEQRLSYLQLERIVRTVYEPSPVLFRETEVGHLPYVYQNGALKDAPKELLWWNFTDHERDYFFSKWYPNELQFFTTQGWEINSPSQQNQLALWQRNVPVLKTENRLILVIPEKVAGMDVQAHSLEGDLKAAFEDISSICYHIGTGTGEEFLSQFYTLPQYVTLANTHNRPAKPVLELGQEAELSTREHETYTSLDNLFYYPHQWLFRYQLDLHPQSILSVVNEYALKGNLSHRFFEKLLKEDMYNWERSAVYEWIDAEAPKLLRSEGAVLLMYGKEPEKVAFLHQVKNAAWTLVRMIQQNGWKVKETEMDLEGYFMGKKIKGKADLVLERDGEYAIVDLKWGGKTKRFNLMNSQEDLQLVLYSRLVTQDETWAHTAYFIISDAVMIARNHNAFQEAITVASDDDFRMIHQSIWQKMERTFAWRQKQIQAGKIEIRTQDTAEELEEMYGSELLQLLEMKGESSRFDDYWVLTS